MSRFRFAGAVFDLDGTLVQSEHLHRRSWMEPLAEQGIAVDDDVYLRDFAGKPGMEIIREQFGLDGEAAIALYDRVTDAYWTMAVEEVAPTRGLLDFLDRIAGTKTAVCTSAQRASAHRMLDLLHLTARFDAIVTATDVLRGKPDPEPFLLAAERISVPGSDCVAFEDSASGLVAARAAGMRCVGIGAGAAVYQDLAEFWIDDFTDHALEELFRR
jgi:HAD superfamily hydrolase (TIGR01509 family)